MMSNPETTPPPGTTHFEIFPDGTQEPVQLASMDFWPGWHRVRVWLGDEWSAYECDVPMEYLREVNNDVQS